MPENEIEIVRGFETTLKNQDEEDEEAYEKIKEAYCEAFEKVDDYGRISLIKMLMHYHQNLGCEIFREMTKSHTEKVVE